MPILKQQIRQFLVHSFLYYQVGESLISDSAYDLLCKQLQQQLPHALEADLPYVKLVQSALGEEASGFSIRNYPEAIVSTALHLLYQERYRQQMSFNEFLNRYGYRMEAVEKADA